MRVPDYLHILLTDSRCSLIFCARASSDMKLRSPFGPISETRTPLSSMPILLLASAQYFFFSASSLACSSALAFFCAVSCWRFLKSALRSANVGLAGGAFSSLAGACSPFAAGEPFPCAVLQRLRRVGLSGCGSPACLVAAAGRRVASRLCRSPTSTALGRGSAGNQRRCQRQAGNTLIHREISLGESAHFTPKSPCCQIYFPKESLG